MTHNTCVVKTAIPHCDSDHKGQTMPNGPSRSQTHARARRWRTFPQLAHGQFAARICNAYRRDDDALRPSPARRRAGLPQDRRSSPNARAPEIPVCDTPSPGSGSAPARQHGRTLLPPCNDHRPPASLQESARAAASLENHACAGNAQPHPFDSSCSVCFAQMQIIAIAIKHISE